MSWGDVMDEIIGYLETVKKLENEAKKDKGQVQPEEKQS